MKPSVINCACLIHGNLYDWTYVERLESMLRRHLSPEVKLHVYTESDRDVPDHMIKHSLIEWDIKKPRRGWWYKLQLFNPEHFSGSMLYFDLDTVITGNIDWIWQLKSRYFWAVRDFKYLWKPKYYGANTSVMWWDVPAFSYVWNSTKNRNLDDLVRRYHGDQDFVTDMIPQEQRRCFDTEWVKSWRWQCLDGGYDFHQRRHIAPGSGTKITPDTSVLVFHGSPKPSEIQDRTVAEHWR